MDTDLQQPYSKDQVDLLDPHVKDRDVSLVHKNVTTHNSGTCLGKTKNGNMRMSQYIHVSAIQLLVEPKRQDEQMGQMVTPGHRNGQGNEQTGPELTLGVLYLVFILILDLSYTNITTNVHALPYTSRRRWSIDRGVDFCQNVHPLPSTSRRRSLIDTLPDLSQSDYASSFTSTKNVNKLIRRSDSK